MKMILLGPPGAGKGTQAEILTKKLELPHISTGDMFRAAISGGTKLGLEAKSYMDKGLLVPDSLTVSIVEERVMQEDCVNGYILDGFPRTVAQAEAFDAFLAKNNSGLDAVINISVPLDILMARLTGRRMCKECGKIYHVINSPSKVCDVCDACGGALYQRSDDTEATVKSRLDVYENQTAPLIQYYGSKNLIHDVNGDAPVAAVLAEVGQLLGRNLN